MAPVDRSIFFGTQEPKVLCLLNASPQPRISCLLSFLHGLFRMFPSVAALPVSPTSFLGDTISWVAALSPPRGSCQANTWENMSAVCLFVPEYYSLWGNSDIVSVPEGSLSLPPQFHYIAQAAFELAFLLP